MDARELKICEPVPADRRVLALDAPDELLPQSLVRLRHQPLLISATLRCASRTRKNSAIIVSPRPHQTRDSERRKLNPRGTRVNVSDSIDLLRFFDLSFVPLTVAAQIHQKLDTGGEFFTSELDQSFFRKHQIRAARHMNQNKLFAFEHSQPLDDVVNVHVLADFRAPTVLFFNKRALADHDLCGANVGAHQLRSQARCRRGTRRAAPQAYG